MATNRFGIDVAEIYKNVESIKGSRTKNKLASLQLSEAEREIAQRPEKERLAKERQTNMASLREQAIGGDSDARSRLLALDPKMSSFVEHLDKADKAEANKIKENIDKMGRMASVVFNTKDPKERQQKYETLKSMLPPGNLKMLPPEYDHVKMEFALAKLDVMDEVADLKFGTLGGEDIMHQGGQVIERAKRPGKGTGESGLTPSQSLAIEKFEYAKGKDQKTALYRAFAGLAKAKISPDGTVVLFNKNQSKWNQALTAATRMLTDGQETDIEAAALRSSERYGLATSTDGVRRFNASTGKIE